MRHLRIRIGKGVAMRYAPRFRLVVVGAGLRLTGASLLVAALWAGFFWATSSTGGP